MTRSDLLRSAGSALLTDSPLRFIRYETISLAGPRAVTYSLRGRRARVVIRHGTTDVEELGFTFLRSLYALPREARVVLDHGRPPQLLDLGARAGLRGLSLLTALPGAELTSVEPDMVNLIILRRTIAANPQLRWRAIRGAVGDGHYLSGPGYARRLPRNATNADRRCRASPVDALALMTDVDLVAMNIHGAEWTVLSDPRLEETAVRVMMVECHAEGSHGGDPIAAAGGLLARAGFTSVVRRGGRSRQPLVIGWRG